MFSSTSIDDLEGAEFVKFPTYIAYFSQFDKHNNYFLLNLDTSVYVYLAFDDRHNTPPWWIEGSFTRLNSATFTSNEHDYIVYRKYAGPGNFTFGSIYMDWEERTNTDNFIFVMVPVPYINTTEDRKNNLQEYPLLYPNPAPDLFILDLGREYQNVSITLYDVSGKLIKFFEFYYKKVLELNADFCPPGIYFLKIVSKESASIIKFIKE